MADSQCLFDLVFELLHERAGICKPSPVQGLVHTFEETVSIADARSSHVQNVVKCLRAASHGETGNAVLIHRETHYSREQIRPSREGRHELEMRARSISATSL